MPGHISRLAIVVCVLAGLVSGRAFVATVAAEAEHIVRDGETLDSIGASHGVPLDQLLALNELADPNALAVGQAIKLPAVSERGAAAPPPGPSAARQTYVIRPGDTVSGIARTSGVAVQALVEANGLTDPNRLVAGQRLAIPEGAGGGARLAAVGGQAAGPAPGPGPPTAGSPVGILDGLARRYGVDPALIRAMAGSSGGLGILRVADATFDYVAGEIVRRPLDRSVAEDNAEAGVAYVAALLRRAGNDPERALALFIQGSGSVQANGVLPATAQQVAAILALRGQPGQSTAATASGQPAGAVVAGREPPGTLAERVVVAARAVAGPRARIGVAGRDLVGGQRLQVAADQTFPAASVVKLAIATEAFRQHENGRRPLTDAVRADLSRMLTASDNAAADRLLDLLGLANVNGVIGSLGLAGTHLTNYFAAAPRDNRVLNRTSPADMARYLDLLAADQVVSPTASRELRTLLFQNQDGSKLRRGLPPDARVAHKSGWFAGVANDVGIVYHGQSAYVLAVFTEGIPSAETANQTVAAIARAVHVAWGPK